MVMLFVRQTFLIFIVIFIILIKRTRGVGDDQHKENNERKDVPGIQLEIYYFEDHGRAGHSGIIAEFITKKVYKYWPYVVVTAHPNETLGALIKKNASFRLTFHGISWGVKIIISSYAIKMVMLFVRQTFLIFIVIFIILIKRTRGVGDDQHKENNEQTAVPGIQLEIYYFEDHGRAGHAGIIAEFITKKVYKYWQYVVVTAHPNETLGALIKKNASFRLTFHEISWGVKLPPMEERMVHNFEYNPIQLKEKIDLNTYENYIPYDYLLEWSTKKPNDELPVIMIEGYRLPSEGKRSS
ncbi:hypothetical protein DdX_22437 [Ditylenchus destructor]|uniref:Uncharacterized protein n=1 Tax=Ditylenchus destructor TaxID=166010 RepID=A0AAD4QQW7_9BILA|nr:hypothetical protein DdX_22437 [Ditylenchus destructor]